MTSEKPIVLIGFMATGKTTVGRLVATRMKRLFLDLDGAIEAASGQPVAEIFKREGEPGFRKHEALALAKALLQQNVVIATGGGAACREDNLRAMLQAGFVVALQADPAEVVRRVGTGSGRPLLDGAADPHEAALRLLAVREPFYARAHARIDTVGRPPEQVATDVINAFESTRSIER
jgi:shikimate kinase